MRTDFGPALFGDVGATSSGSAQRVASGAALAAGLFVIGTGGSFALGSDIVRSTSSSHDVVIVDAGAGANPDSDLFLSPAARIAVVRRWLSLTITDLAEAMRVQRPTIYAWMAARSTPHADNLERMRQLHRLARAWQRIGRQPLTRLSHAREAKREVLKLLSRAVIDESALIATYNALAPTSSKERTRLSQIAAEAGVEPVPHQDSRSLDLETLT